MANIANNPLDNKLWLDQRDHWKSDPNNFNYYGDPITNNSPCVPAADEWIVPITSPNTAIPYIPPIQFPPPPQMPAPTYQYVYIPDIKVLADRIAELELKVSQLLVILDYITGVKDGTKPKDVQSEEKTAKTDT